MQRLKHIDFVRRRIVVTPGVCALAALALVAAAWATVTFLRVSALDDDVVSLQQRLDVERVMDTARRAKQKGAPEERKIDAVVSAQVAAKAHGAVPLLTKIGEAWKPQVALLSVSVQRAGNEAKISGEAQELGQVYAFVDRLQSGPSGLRAMLLRHGVKTSDPKKAITFDIDVVQR